MMDFITKILESIGIFIQYNWISICWFLIVLYLIRIIRKSEEGRNWAQTQFEWLKGFFYDDDEVVGTPNHKNLILFALVAVFSVAYLKKVVSSTDVPDIPSGWQIVILAALGINQARSTAQKFFESRWNKDANNAGSNTVGVSGSSGSSGSSGQVN